MKVSEGSNVKLSVLKEDLVVGDRSTIECTGEGMSLKVEGDIKCEGAVEFAGSVSCSNFTGDDCKIRTGSLSCESLTIRDGSLEVLGDLFARSIDVDKKLVVRGRTEAQDIEVGGTLELVTVKARSIEVGGKFRASSDVEADNIDVGGIVEIQGKIKSRSVEVGGKVWLNGGDITDRIEVGGVFESTQPLNFGNIDVGGVITLGGSSKGGNIEVGGKLQARGDIVFKNLDVGGVADVKGNAQGERIDLGGRLRVDSNLRLTDSLEIGGAADVLGDTEAKYVDIGGSFKSRSLKAETADFRGRVRTERGIFASGRIHVGRKCRVEGWIRSMDSVTVGSHGEVDSVSAPRVTMGDRSKAANIYAEVLEIDDRVEIYGEALYTHSISSHSSGQDKDMGAQPRKVDYIPPEKKWTQEAHSSSPQA